MRILKGMQKVPGGMMVIPLVLGAAINTIEQSVDFNILNIGGFTQALFRQGALPLIALFVLCHGAQINVRQAGLPVAKGAVFTIVKVAVGGFIGLAVGWIFGPEGFWGLAPLAVVAAMVNCNGGLYVTLASQYGDSTDVGAISILSITDGPFFTMVVLGAAGFADIPFIAFVAVLVPIVIGFILGNLDEDWRNFLKQGTHLLIPFFAFPLGAGLTFRNIIDAGPPGILLGLATVLVIGTVGLLSTRIFGKLRAAGVAIGTTAGNAALVPLALANIDPSLVPFEPEATVMVATSVLVTAILCPFYVAWWDKRLGGKADREKAAAEAGK